MGERKSQNKYIPVDFNPSIHSTLNGYHHSHHLGARAKKLNQGILVIRFETPYNFICLGCNNHVAKGVRYNSEKKTVGEYFSTKILEFSMKCHLCPNIIKFQTDPKGCDYIITEGGRKKVETFDAEDAGIQLFLDKETKKKIFSDPMAKLEHIADDKKVASLQKDRLEQIMEIQERTHNTLAISQMIEKKILQEVEKESIRENLPYKLLPSSLEDEATIDDQIFANKLKTAAVTHRVERAKIVNQPIINTSSSENKKNQELLLKKAQLNISSKTLGSQDRKLKPNNAISYTKPKLLIKRKASETSSSPSPINNNLNTHENSNSMSLLQDYSD